MRKLWLLLTLSLMAASYLIGGDAQAKRLASGRSTGSQNMTLSQRAATAPTVTPGKATVPDGYTRQQRPAGNWGRVLGGLAAGLGLAALVHALGLGPGLANALVPVLLIGFALFAGIALVNMLRKSAVMRAPQPAGAWREGYDAGQLGQESYLPAQRIEELPPVLSRTPMTPGPLPAGFDQRAFLNQARQQYYQLQEAWDARDLATIKANTTPELFSQLRTDIGERGTLSDKTDVVTLEAVLLDLQKRENAYFASVEFSGLVREESWGGAQPVREVWNLTKPAAGESHWVLAGVQQLT